jgi:hypothetical protein
MAAGRLTAKTIRATIAAKADWNRTSSPIISWAKPTAPRINPSRRSFIVFQASRLSDTMTGSRNAIDIERWPSMDCTIAGANPNTAPATAAAGWLMPNRSRQNIMADAVRTGASVIRTLYVTRGPALAVSQLMRRAGNGIDVFDIRLIPTGRFMASVKNGLCATDIACTHQPSHH